MTFKTSQIKIYAIWTDKEIEPAPVPTPAPETPQVPQTGDSTPLGLWMALIVLSCIGAAVLPVLLRSKERRS